MTQRFCVTCRKRRETPTGKKCPFRRESAEMDEALRRSQTDSNSFDAISSQLRAMQGQMSSFAEQLSLVQANRADKEVVCTKSTVNGTSLSGELNTQNFEQSTVPQVDDTDHATPHDHHNPTLNVERLNERSYEADKETVEVTNCGLDNLNSNNRVRHVRFGDPLDTPVSHNQAPTLLPVYNDGNGADVRRCGADESLARLQRGIAGEPLARFQRGTADEPLARFQRGLADEPLARFQRGVADEPLARFQHGRAEEPLARSQQRRQDGASTGLQRGQDNDYIDYELNCRLPTAAYGVPTDGMEAYMRDNAPRSPSVGYIVENCASGLGRPQSAGLVGSHGSTHNAGVSPYLNASSGVSSNFNGYLPSVSGFRGDQRIADALSNRLVQLGLDDSDHSSESAKKKGKKSGVSRTVEDQVLREIDWPHLYVYRGQDRKPATYNDLTLAEFIFGYISMIDNPRNILDKELMLQTLRNMMLDTTQYGWVQVRNFYIVF